MARDPTDSLPGPRERPDRRWAVVYDAGCGFCRWSLSQLLGRDRARVLRPVALGTPEADALLSDLTAQEREASWHLVSPDGRRVSAGDAAAPLLRLLPGGRRPAAVLQRMPSVTERTYRFVADHRSWFSRLISDRAKVRADRRIAQRGRDQ